MGGDNAPDTVVRGALNAHSLGVEIILVGDETEIKSRLDGQGAKAHHISVVHAPTVIGMGDKALVALRKDKETSMEVSIRLVAEGKAQGIATAGNSGAAVVLASRHLKRAGLGRPVLGTFLPMGHPPAFLLDVGANTDTTPADLVGFAHLGSAFYENWSGEANPKVGLLNIGGEKGKGDKITREAYNLLAQEEGLNFVGNVEGRALGGGVGVHVVVCDGFVGNIILKFAEGFGSAMLRFFGIETREALAGKWWAPWLKGTFNAPILATRKRVDYAEYGGAPLLGLTGAFFICHGSSSAKAIFHAVRRMKIMVERGLHE